EDDGVVVDGVDVGLLAGGFGADRFAAPRDDVAGQHVGRGVGRGAAGGGAGGAVLVADDSDGAGDRVGGQFVAAARHRFEFLEHARGGGDVVGPPGDGDGGAAGVHVGAKEVLEQPEVAVGVAEHRRRVLGVELDDRLGAVGDGVSGRFRHAG